MYLKQEKEEIQLLEMATKRRACSSQNREKKTEGVDELNLLKG